MEVEGSRQTKGGATAAGVPLPRMGIISHLGATKAWAPAAQATAMTADFIVVRWWGEGEGKGEVGGRKRE